MVGMSMTCAPAAADDNDPAPRPGAGGKFGGKFDPEKLKEIREKLKNLDPEKLKELREKFQNLDPDQKKELLEKLKARRGDKGAIDPEKLKELREKLQNK
jgi:DNA-directed RNA polymerase subunit F